MSARDEELKKLSAASDPTDAPKDDRRAAFDGVEAEDFGGTVKVGVLFDYYNVNADGAYRVATKGQVIKVEKSVADRGEALGGLVRL